MKLLILVIAPLAAVQLASQVKVEPGSIHGVVRVEAGGPPLADLDVRVRGNQTKTDSTGRYSLSGIPAGRHHVTVGMPGRSTPAFGSKMVTIAGPE